MPRLIDDLNALHDHYVESVNAAVGEQRPRPGRPPRRGVRRGGDPDDRHPRGTHRHAAAASPRHADSGLRTMIRRITAPRRLTRPRWPDGPDSDRHDHQSAATTTSAPVITSRARTTAAARAAASRARPAPSARARARTTRAPSPIRPGPPGVRRPRCRHRRARAAPRRRRTSPARCAPRPGRSARWRARSAGRARRPRRTPSAAAVSSQPLIVP